MSEDYLWDRSGEPDPEVVELEEALAALRFREPPLVVAPEPEAAPPPSQRRGSIWTSVATAAAATLAAALLAWWWGYAVGQRHGEPAQRAPAVAMQTPPPAPPVPLDPAPPKVQQNDADVDAEPAQSDEHERPRAHGRRAKGKASSSSPSKSSSSSSKGSSSKHVSSTEVSVDCILDPSRCETTSDKKSTKRSGDLDPARPEKLTTSDIKNGINPLKSEAKACGAKHGAAPGEKVRILMRISGETGTVTTSLAQQPHTGTPLGNCVAAVLKKAQFPTFRKASIGVVYPVRL